MFETIAWTDGGVVMLDQRRLPAEEIYLTLTTPEEVAGTIRSMAIRGAPAIGVAAAMGLALGAKRLAATATDRPEFARGFLQLCDLFAAARPTAVNLFWAIERMKRTAGLDAAAPSPASGGTPSSGPTARPFAQAGAAPAPAAASAREESAGGVGPERAPARIAERLVEEAGRIKAEDLAACRAMGRIGAELVPDGATILTHCNAGALATAGYGTALGVVRAAKESGKKIRVLADETRPFLQGARLTAWELLRDGIETTIITDSMAGHFFRKGEITLAIVGADRIAANGDVANKIGTYPVAVLARENGIPFYVAAPISTIDLSLATGEEIPIEERSSDEVTRVGGLSIAPEGARARHPAFDVTPARYVTAIITEAGVARAPYEESLRTLFATVRR